MAFGGLLGVVLLAAAALCLTSGCASIGYLAQSLGGHLALLRAARPVDEWLADGTTPPSAARAAGRLSQRIRDFAVRELRLPDNRSYRRYADLDGRRRCGTWWRRPSCRCSSRRGASRSSAASAIAAISIVPRRMRWPRRCEPQGLEVMVYGVPAYSTLGWSEWLGGDPLLNTFIRFPEGELARMVIPRALAPGGLRERRHDVQRVVRHRGRAPRRRALAAPSGRRRRAHRILALRRAARAVPRADRQPYRGAARRRVPRRRQRRSRSASARPRSWRRCASTTCAARASGAASRGYDGWFERANNASFGVLAAYNELVPAFVRLFEREGGDFTRFYAEVRAHRRLAEGRAPGDTGRGREDRLTGACRCPTSSIHREHALGLAKARKVAWQWAEQVEKKFGMECTVVEGDDERHGRIHARRRQRHADRRGRSFRPAREARPAARRVQQDDRSSEIEKNLDALLGKSAAAKKAAPKKTKKPS